MIQTDYALSYNMKTAVIDVLKSIADFKSWTKADNFVVWFNEVIGAKDKVTMIDICNKAGKTADFEPKTESDAELAVAFRRIGFTDEIPLENIVELTDIHGNEYYRVIFPVPRDFSKKAQQMEVQRKAEARAKALKKVRLRKKAET